MDLRELLDERPLDGLYGMERRLGPSRAAFALRDGDLEDAVRAIELACQLWGGGATALVPATAAKPPLNERWQTFLDKCLVDQVWHRDACEGLSYRGSDKRVVERELGDFLVAALDAAPTPRDKWMPVGSARPAPDDDWFIAYAAALGLWPKAPDPHLVERFNYRSGLSWDQVIPSSEELIAEPGPADLLNRLRDPDKNIPARISMASLAAAIAPRAASLQSIPVLPVPDERARQLGPNLVVVYEPGSVEDLALLWNLRMANGLPDGLPLGVPRNADPLAAIRHWQQEFAFQMWTLGHDRCALTSTTVETSELESLADAAGSLWSVARPEEVLRDSDRPSRRSYDIATFNAGMATLPGWDPGDREAIGRRRSNFHEFKGVVRFRLRDRRIPPSRALESDYSFGPSYRGGGFESPEAGYDSLTPITWPAGWTVVEALAFDRELRVKPSPAGLAAAALLERIGSIPAVSAIASERVVEMLYRLAERSGMTWFRRKLREIGGAVEDGDRPRLEQALDSLSVGDDDEQRQETTFSALVELLGRDGGEAWLRWAEEREILIRGARIRCGHCGARSWRAIEELGPALVCRGCGREIASPFPPGELPFAYRASQAVLQAMEHDAIVQVLAIRWLTTLMRGSEDSPGRLFGIYPGVEFFEKGASNPIGEADLLLVQSDGELVVGECKRRGAGLDAGELAKLELLADRLGSPWSFLATADRASACPLIWPEAGRALPAKPRFSLTAEQLFDRDPIWALGDNPFAWRQLPGEDHETREREFADRLADYLERIRGEGGFQEHLMREEIENWEKGNPGG